MVTENTLEPEVVKAVQAEIVKLGENTKANYEELRKNHEGLKKLIDEKGAKSDMDALVKEQATKLTEDITTRQTALDQKIAETTEKVKSDLEKMLDNLATKRIDAVETAMKRSPLGSPESLVKEAKDAEDFILHTSVVRDKGGKGITWEQAEKMAADANMDEYRAYCKSLVAFLRKDERLLGPDVVKALTVGIDPDGGYTVTPAMSSRIIRRMFESDPVRQLAGNESITTGALEFMVDYDEAGWGWEGETETGAETDTPQIYKKRIPVHVMYAKPKASQTLIEDSGINIENWLADKVSSRFLRGEGAAFVNGNGVGKPRGFLTYDDGANYGQIERVNMRAAAAVTADGYIALKYSLIEEFLNRGTWLMNRSTVADTMYLKDGAGRYIWKPGFQDDAQATILGLPVRMATSMPAVAAGIRAVALADWSEAYMVVDRLGITVQRDPFTSKPMVEFYTRKRVGGDVVNYQSIKLGNIAV